MIASYMQEALLLDMARAAVGKLEVGEEHLDDVKQQQQQGEGQARQKGILLIFEGLSEGILMGICHDAAAG